MSKIEEILNKQKEFFKSKATLSLSFRLQQLDKLKHSILANLDTLLDAFKKDFNKCEYDVFTTEVGLVLEEIKYMKKHITKFFKPKKAKGGLTNFPSKAKIVYEPYGNVLIMAPWNYPFQLAMNPLIGAIACGNTAIVKPSAYTPEVSACINQILSVFEEQYIAVVLGGREQNQELLEQKFDLIFFTGSKSVGQVVQEKASKHSCPIILELGGKCPCIVDDSANIETAVKRIVWGKFLNAGQTCVAPDYIFVPKDKYDNFLELVKKQIEEFYYKDGVLTDDFPFIINDKHAERIKNLIEPEQVVCGGKVKNRLIEPTVLKDVNFDDKVMQEEIFGPIMPVLSYENLEDVITYVNSKDKPLALYFFSTNKERTSKIIEETSSGAVCINETVMHVATNTLPFGGVGGSGMGNYHGEHSLRSFSHMKPVLIKGPNFELKLKYPPITKSKRRWSYRFLGIKY